MVDEGVDDASPSSPHGDKCFVSLPVPFSLEDNFCEDDRLDDLFSIEDGFHGYEELHFYYKDH